MKAKQIRTKGDVRKVCDKCREKSWVRPRERHCKRIGRNAFGRTGYLCWGTLKKVPKRTARPTDDGAYLANYRRVTTGRLIVAEARVEKWRRRLLRAQARQEKWAKRVAALQKLGAKTDAEVLAKRDRIKIAHRVKIVRRRLLGKGLPKTKDPLALLAAGQQ